MSTLFLKFGEHILLSSTVSKRVENILIKNYQASKVIKSKTDLIVYLEEGYGVPFINYEVIISKNLNTVSYSRADYLIEVDSEFKEAKIKFHDDLALKHALMNLYSSFIVHHNWGLLIHSSCVKENGKAHIFSGHSGAGKSTAARLSQPRELLSDEATIVKISSEEVMIFNSPFNSELKSNCKETSLPLSSIQLLHQSLQNNRIRLKKADGLLQLIDKVFFWEHSHYETKRILELLKALVNAVPVYDLHFQKNDTFWELIS